LSKSFRLFSLRKKGLKFSFEKKDRCVTVKKQQMALGEFGDVIFPYQQKTEAKSFGSEAENERTEAEQLGLGGQTDGRRPASRSRASAARRAEPRDSRICILAAHEKTLSVMHA
jgi:hypothetical protein